MILRGFSDAQDMLPTQRLGPEETNVGCPMSLGTATVIFDAHQHLPMCSMKSLFSQRQAVLVSEVVC